MSGRRSRNKGKRGELEVVHALRPFYPDARRSIAQTRDGDEAPDVDGTPWHVEVKRQARPNVWAALQQAEHDTKGRPPVAWCTRDGGETVVAMRPDLFLLFCAAHAVLTGGGDG